MYTNIYAKKKWEICKNLLYPVLPEPKKESDQVIIAAPPPSPLMHEHDQVIIYHPPLPTYLLWSKVIIWRTASPPSPSIDPMIT